MGNYSYQIKDQRWQKQRRKILKRDEYKCRSCDTNNAKMHVHHLYYDILKSAWEYNDETLITLCEYCHKTLHLLEENNIDLNFAQMVSKCIRDQEFKNMNNE